MHHPVASQLPSYPHNYAPARRPFFFNIKFSDDGTSELLHGSLLDLLGTLALLSRSEILDEGTAAVEGNDVLISRTDDGEFEGLIPQRCQHERISGYHNVPNIRAQQHFQHREELYWSQSSGLQLRRITIQDYYLLASEFDLYGQDSLFGCRHTSH